MIKEGVKFHFTFPSSFNTSEFMEMFHSFAMFTKSLHKLRYDSNKVGTPQWYYVVAFSQWLTALFGHME